MHSPTLWPYGETLGVMFQSRGYFILLRVSKAYVGYLTSCCTDGGYFHPSTRTFDIVGRLAGTILLISCYSSSLFFIVVPVALSLLLLN